METDDQFPRICIAVVIGMQTSVELENPHRVDSRTTCGARVRDAASAREDADWFLPKLPQAPKLLPDS